MLEKNKYSKKEIKLIEYFYPNLIEPNYYETIMPVVLYRMMVKEAFLKNYNNIFTQSLRRCYQAIVDCEIYRLTPEWDTLISDKVLGYQCFCELSSEFHNVTIYNKCKLCDVFLHDKMPIPIPYPNDGGLVTQVRDVEETQSVWDVLKKEFDLDKPDEILKQKKVKINYVSNIIKEWKKDVAKKPSGSMKYEVKKGSNLLPFI
jgi:hypothetical protein